MLPQRQEIGTVVVCEDDEATLELLCEHLAADRFGVMPAPALRMRCASAATTSPTCSSSTSPSPTPPGSTSCARSAAAVGPRRASTLTCP
jgi:hypothetical protein